MEEPSHVLLQDRCYQVEAAVAEPFSMMTQFQHQFHHYLLNYHKCRLVTLQVLFHLETPMVTQLLSTIKNVRITTKTILYAIQPEIS